MSKSLAALANEIRREFGTDKDDEVDDRWLAIADALHLAWHVVRRTKLVHILRAHASRKNVIAGPRYPAWRHGPKGLDRIDWKRIPRESLHETVLKEYPDVVDLADRYGALLQEAVEFLKEEEAFAKRRAAFAEKLANVKPRPPPLLLGNAASYDAALADACARRLGLKLTPRMLAKIVAFAELQYPAESQRDTRNRYRQRLKAVKKSTFQERLETLGQGSKGPKTKGKKEDA